MEIYLHLGAHKTASTHLQKALVDQREALRDQGVAVTELGKFRRDFTPAFWKIQSGDISEAALRRAREVLASFAGDANRLVVSDENLPGLVLRANHRNRFYPGAERNMALLKDVFGAPPAKVFLSTRSLETFLVSSYIERLRHEWVPDFQTFLCGTRPEMLSWANLVLRLRSALGDPRMVVWRYEDYRKLGPEVAREMTGQDIDLSGGVVRPGASARGVEEVLRAGRNGTDVVAESMVDRMVEAYPKGPDWPAYDPWEPELKHRLQVRYAEDIARLAELEGVRLLRP